MLWGSSNPEKQTLLHYNATIQRIRFFTHLVLTFFIHYFSLLILLTFLPWFFPKKRANDTVEAEKKLKTKYTTWKQLPFCYFFYRMFSFGKCYSLCELHFTKAPSYLISPILQLAIVESCVLCFTYLYFHKISAAQQQNGRSIDG